MRARRPGPARRTRPLTQEELTACREAIERDNPGYMDENTKLTQLVKTLTGVRMLSGIFNICMFKMYDLSLVQPIILFFSAFFFLFWYMWMLRSGKLVAVFMMCVRGYSIISGGAALLNMAGWLPYPLIFMLTAAGVMEFVEAVFCIYVLFHPFAAHTIRLNKALFQRLMRAVDPVELNRMAGYQNPYGEDTDQEGPGPGSDEGGRK